MRTVKEISRLTGVSVRTLHHYDAIDLLKPAKVTKAGYRLYDDAALSRLQSILLFRELQFPLKDIKKILDSPDFDQQEALSQQIHLLELRLKHTKELISFARKIQEKGVNSMDFHAFDQTKIDRYAAEVKERWGNTMAYKESQIKAQGKTQAESAEASEKFMSLFATLGTLKSLAPEEKQVQDIVKQLQDFITENYYTCTDEILKGLGQMYVCDERMKLNIDKAGGDGAAEFARQAIEAYCAAKK